MKLLSAMTLRGDSDSALEAVTAAQVDDYFTALPKGKQQRVTLTAAGTTDSTAAGATTDSTLTFSATLSSTRCYVVICTGWLQTSSTSSDNMTVQVFDGATMLGDSGVVYSNNVVGTGCGFVARGFLNAPTSGSHTFTVKVWNVNGTAGTVSILGSVSSPATLLLMDLGPAL